MANANSSWIAEQACLAPTTIHQRSFCPWVKGHRTMRKPLSHLLHRQLFSADPTALGWPQQSSFPASLAVSFPGHILPQCHLAANAASLCTAPPGSGRGAQSSTSHPLSECFLIVRGACAPASVLSHRCLWVPLCPSACLPLACCQRGILCLAQTVLQWHPPFPP